MTEKNRETWGKIIAGTAALVMGLSMAGCANSSDDNNKEEQKGNKDNSEKIESKIQEIKEEATKEQRDMENQYKNFGKEFSRNEKNW